MSVQAWWKPPCQGQAMEEQGQAFGRLSSTPPSLYTNLVDHSEWSSCQRLDIDTTLNFFSILFATSLNPNRPCAQYCRGYTHIYTIIWTHTSRHRSPTSARSLISCTDVLVIVIWRGSLADSSTENRGSEVMTSISSDALGLVIAALAHALPYHTTHHKKKRREQQWR